MNLYLLPVLAPGSRKTAVTSDATRPLYTAEEELVERARGQVAEAVMLRQIAERAAEKAMRAAAADHGNADLKSDAISAAHHAEAIAVPSMPQLIADDITPEAVASLLAEQGGRLAVISAEGGIFDMMAGRYSGRVPVLDVWLKGHAGDPLRVDRKGRPSEYVKTPALTMLLTVQPVVLANIAKHGEFRGRGLLARFLYSIPADNVGRRRIGAPPVPSEVVDTYAQHVRKLTAELAEWTDPAVLTLTPDAQKLLLGVERAIEPRLVRDGEYGGIREWAAKLVGTTVRLAGLLHLASEEEAFRTPISVDTLSAATRLAGYFAEHAQAAFGLLGSSDASDAAYLLEFLNRRDIEGFSIRELTTDLPRGRFPTADDVKAAVEVLVEHGWVLPVPPPEHNGPGRKPSPRFLCHPAVKDYEVAAESAQSAELGVVQGSADCADNAATSPPEWGAA